MGRGSGRGRPRDAELDRRILDVALAELARRGYEGMTIEGVAVAAGVPKPTVYRRWSSKAEVATAALRLLQSREPPPRGRTTPARLIFLLARFRENLLRPNGMAMLGTLLSEEVRHPELLELFRRRIVVPRRRMIRATLKRGVSRGEVRQDVDLEAVINLLVGSFYARYLTGRTVGPSWPRRAVQSVWRGIAA